MTTTSIRLLAGLELEAKLFLQRSFPGAEPFGSIGGIPGGGVPSGIFSVSTPA
jgi:hypothetical protein